MCSDLADLVHSFSRNMAPTRSQILLRGTAHQLPGRTEPKSKVRRLLSTFPQPTALSEGRSFQDPPPSELAKRYPPLVSTPKNVTLSRAAPPGVGSSSQSGL